VAKLRGAEAVLTRADAVIFSEQDVVGSSDIERYASLTSRDRVLVVTRGGRGASVYRNEAWRHFPAFQPRRQADPTGAGDVFAAAYLLRLHTTGDPYVSAEFANCVASFAVEKRHHGGVPTLEQVQARWLEGKRRKRFGPT